VLDLVQPLAAIRQFCRFDRKARRDEPGRAGAPLTIPATVRVLRGSGTVDTLNVTIEVGRKWFHFLHADDQAASVQLNPPPGFRPQVTALVEYTTP
jgi:hypothetical protein